MRRKSKKIKINLQKLPYCYEVTPMTWKFYDKPAIHNQVWRAISFLIYNNQVSPHTLALDAINEKQPEMIEKKDLKRDYCNKCLLRDNCPIKHHTDETKAQICQLVPIAYANPLHGFQGRNDKPMDYTRDDRQAIADAWEIPLS